LRTLALLGIGPWVLGAAVGCSGMGSATHDPGGSVQIDTVDGVVLVRNTGHGIWNPGEEWVVEEVFRLGGRPAPQEERFSNFLLSVSLGPQGEILVLDQQASRVTVFSGEGAFIREIGGPGRGPGEFVRPSALGWDGAYRLWVAEAFNGRYSVFDSVGDFLKTEPRELRAVARFQHPLVSFNGATLIDEGASSAGVLFVRVDTAGEVIDTLAPLPFPKIPSNVSNLILLPKHDAMKEVSRYYFSRLIWCLSPDGTTWSATTGEMKLIQRAPNGDTLRVVETTHRAIPLSEEDNRTISEGLAQMGLSRNGLTLVRPVLQAIHVLDDGHILVQVVEAVGEDSDLFDVFDPMGRYLGSIRTGFAISPKGIPAIRGDTIIAVSLGEYDVPYVVRATIRRPTS